MISDPFELEGCGLSTAPFTVHEEPAWRIPPGLTDEHRISQRIIVSRWRGTGPAAHAQTPWQQSDYHTVAINLKDAVITLKSIDNTLHEGPIAAGMIQVSAPDEDLRIATRGAYDWLHIHVSNMLLARCLHPRGQRKTSCGITLLRHTPILDPVLEGLAHALLNVGDTSNAYAQLYAGGITMALLSRLICVHSIFAPATQSSRTKALVRWRLKRALDYMEEHIADPITLPDVATAVGLTRMHFAAQFRAATGLRPREFFLRRRIEYAKHLLLESTDALVDIALITGFQTQAHFTTVFKRFVGATPHQWRCKNHHSLSSEPRVSVPQWRMGEAAPRTSL
jgi:AraC family transcriptional regulator